jgi:hypothetical protein
MSVPEDIQNLKQILKPFLKFKVGDQVYLKTDKKRTYPMLVMGYELEDYNCDDYIVSWFNSQGKMENDSLPEECLTR